MLCKNTKSKVDKQSNCTNLCLAPIHIEHDIIFLDDVEIHKVYLADISDKIELDVLYRIFGIIQPHDLKQSSFSRKLDYLMGRLAGQYALKKYKLEFFNIIKGKYGEPIFPNFVQGSISHVNDRKDYIAICAIQSFKLNNDYIGIDIELNKNKNLFINHSEMIDVFLNRKEQERIKKEISRSQPQYNHYDAMALLIFSAKESVIKAIFNKYKKIIDFKTIHFQKISERDLHFKVKLCEESLFFLIVKVTYFQERQQILTIARI